MRLGPFASKKGREAVDEQSRRRCNDLSGWVGTSPAPTTARAAVLASEVNGSYCWVFGAPRSYKSARGEPVGEHKACHLYRLRREEVTRGRAAGGSPLGDAGLGTPVG